MKAANLIPLVRQNCRLVVLRSVDSTNDEVRRLHAASLAAAPALAQAQVEPSLTPPPASPLALPLASSPALPLAPPLVVLSERQTAGRGRRGHVWTSPPGSIYLSLLWSSAATPEQAAQLPLVAALAAREALSPCTEQVISVKWPNDLLTPEGKLAGILVENVSSGGAWVIGVGANVAPPEDGGVPGAAYLSRPNVSNVSAVPSAPLVSSGTPDTSSTQGASGAPRIEAVAAALIDALLTSLQRWEQAGCEFAPFEDDYQRYLLR